jgi:hypothetical protein
MSQFGEVLHGAAPIMTVLGIGGIWAWYRLERIKLEKGYPIENVWGKPMHPAKPAEDMTALRSELDRKSAQVNRLEERVATLERILTDRSSALAAEIDRLRS